MGELIGCSSRALHWNSFQARNLGSFTEGRMLAHNRLTHLGLQFSPNHVHSTLFSPKITLLDREDRSKWDERSSAGFRPSINITPLASPASLCLGPALNLKPPIIFSFFAQKPQLTLVFGPPAPFLVFASLAHYFCQQGLSFHLLAHVLLKSEFLRGCVQPRWL